MRETRPENIQREGEGKNKRGPRGGEKRGRYSDVLDGGEQERVRAGGEDGGLGEGTLHQKQGSNSTLPGHHRLLTGSQVRSYLMTHTNNLVTQLKVTGKQVTREVKSFGEFASLKRQLFVAGGCGEGDGV